MLVSVDGFRDKIKSIRCAFFLSFFLFFMIYVVLILFVGLSHSSDSVTSSPFEIYLRQLSTWAGVCLDAICFIFI